MSEAEQRRYDRQVRLPGFGAEGQRRLGRASALLVGAGGLGTPAALYLAAAGIGRLSLIDPDRIETSNLHRQVLYTDADVGQLKVEVLRRRLQGVNPYVQVDVHPVAFGPENALGLVNDHDVVLDGTDRFETRYLVNDACVLTGRPNVFASVHQFDGQASVFGLSGQPCYRCVYPQPPPPGLVPSCADAGVLGVLPGLLGTIQATEAIKLLAGLGTSLAGRLLLLNALTMAPRTLQIDRDPACPVCGDAPTLTTLDVSSISCTMPIPEITVQDLHAMDERGTRPFVVDVREPSEYEIGNIGGALIPLGQLPDRLDELAPHREDAQIVVHCRSGGRSGKAVEFLQSQGYTNAVNLKGGILAWNAEIDPSVSTEMPA